MQYWPEVPLSTEAYGGVTVEMTVERNSGHYTYRELHVTNKEVRLASSTLYVRSYCSHIVRY